MKVVMIPGLEAALKALAEEGKIPLDADGNFSGTNFSGTLAEGRFAGVLRG